MIKDTLSLDVQVELLSLARKICATAPLYKAEMPNSKKPFSYSQSGAGWGWTSGHGAGYRYQRTHPITGLELPSIPPLMIDIAQKHGLQADSLLINWYPPGASLGLHQDRDEKDLTSPIVSISLGDHGIFLRGGLTRQAATQEIILLSGSVFVMEGKDRMLFHGLKSIIPNTCIYPGLVKNPGRINLTLRKSQ
jgi:alkylated DNA repair protein (DNA oxidative demethylase)